MTEKFEMADERNDEIINGFLMESEQNIHYLNDRLLALEESVKDGREVEKKEIDSMFRAAHTIKGTASFISLTTIAELTHKIETILDRVRKKEISISEKVIDVLFSGLDSLGGLLRNVKDNNTDQTDISTIIKKLIEASEPDKANDDVAQDVDKKYLAMFVDDSGENVERFSDMLLKLESGDFKQDYLNEIFRMAHTIKGAAGIIKREDIETFAHKMEDVLSKLREAGKPPGTNIISIMFKCIDRVKQAVDSIHAGKTEKIDADDLIDELDGLLGKKEIDGEKKMEEQGDSVGEIPVIEIASLGEEKLKKVKAAIEGGCQLYRVTIAISGSCASKGLKAIVVFERIKRMGTIIDTIPKDTDIDDSSDKKTFIQYLLAAGDSEEKISSILNISDIEVISIEKEDFNKKNAAKPTPAPEKTQTISTPVELTTMRVDIRKLDSLMNLAGELVIMRARLSQLVKGLPEELASADTKTVKNKIVGLEEATNALEKLSSEIQGRVMQTRMVQIEGVFSRFRRLVRDISKDLKKEVKFEVFGEDTELDKAVADELNDPLMHMIRNAIGHGIEPKEERVKKGKPSSGKVILGASHGGNCIWIEISDDGNGIDCEKIVQKAIEKGLIDEDSKDELKEKEKLNLIFMPGFSMAEEVTGLSGRGVGMDVVKTMIESFSGSVDIESELGKGTTFKMRIPLTLSIVQALLVEINNQVLAVPIESVSEIIKVDPSEMYSIEGSSTIKLRDHTLSIVSLDKIIKTEKLSEDGNENCVIVITEGQQSLGIPVEKLIGEEEIVIKALPECFSKVSGISGASILGNGRIALILDTAGVIRAAR